MLLMHGVGMKWHNVQIKLVLMQAFLMMESLQKLMAKENGGKDWIHRNCMPKIIL